ncbi:MAG: type II toxin-antitoxin system Phd/YefM family antitoxin [bacterium]|nr:type II toxin-antitoxin system Phd/YefM family antitoxin [bacterium]
MNFEEDIKSVTYLKSQSAKLLNQVTETHRPVIITQKGKAKAVVQDVASYKMTRKALLLLKLIAQGEEDVRQGRTIGQSEVMSRIETKLVTMENQHE